VRARLRRRRGRLRHLRGDSLADGIDLEGSLVQGIEEESLILAGQPLHVLAAVLGIAVGLLRIVEQADDRAQTSVNPGGVAQPSPHLRRQVRAEPGSPILSRLRRHRGIIAVVEGLVVFVFHARSVVLQVAFLTG